VNVVITGAAGFLGRVLARTLLNAWPEAEHRFLLVDRHAVDDLHDARIVQMRGDLADIRSWQQELAAADVVFHLAAVPGGAAERDYDASRRINLDATLAMLDVLAHRAAPARLVYASSIAVFGEPLPAIIDDETSPRPTLTYGAHKLMIETAIANLARLGRCDGYALRLPGIVARPAGDAGMKSAFMSELFHAAVARRALVVPTGPQATVWVMSATCAAANLLHAAQLAAPAAGVARAFTLPALRMSMQSLVAAVARHTGCDPALFRFEADEQLEGQFGRLPPLRTAIADALGFEHDGEADVLVARALGDAGYLEAAHLARA
jgi:D-erythronate 2-dehydrogenase